MIVFTKKEETVVYNQQGKVHGSSPVRGAVMPLEVSTAFRDVPERGRCYQISSSGAFIRVDDVVADTTPNPPPVEPPPATGELPAYFTAHDDNDNELARYVRQ